MRKLSVLGGLTVLLAFVGLAHAAPVSIDFNTSSPVSPTYSGSATTSGGLVPLSGQTGDWNVLDLGTSLGGLSTPVSVFDALDGDGVATDIDFTLNTNSQLINVWDGPGGTDSLGNDIAFVTSNALVGWAFDGLEADTSYTIRFFGQVNPADGAAVSFALINTVGGTPATAQASSGQNYVDIVVTSDVGGTITGTFERPFSGGTGALSGVQIAVVPEPASLALLSLGALLMASRCRRS